MKNTTIQIEILELLKLLAIYGPYSEINNKAYNALRGRFEKTNDRRWLVPNNAPAKAKIVELFGEAGPSVIVSVTGKHLVTCGSQLQHGGYVAASFDERKNLVWLPDGVELVSGAWDSAASTAGKTPCLTDPDAVIHIVVWRNYADTHGLKIVEELPEAPITNSLARYPDADLIAELVRRGYRVEQEIC